MIRTKIVCTLGPACDDEAVLSAMVREGMDCARFNFSHGSHEEHISRLKKLRSVCQQLDTPIAALLDTKGPEIRTGCFERETELRTGEFFTLTAKEVTGNCERCSISYSELYKDVEKGAHILIDDGLISLRVERIEENGDIVCIVENGGMISSKKGVNVPNAKINLPAMTEQDISDIKFGVENDFDYVAMSFVRKASDVLNMRRLLENLGGGDIKIIAKIENREGIDNFKEILRASDGIMIARGDMGVEIPVEEVPIVQKSIIKQTYSACKPVITATQMLDSMMRNPRPTRAEASDVANAIFDGTSAIMLSGETAAGSYPLEALRMMTRIAKTTEKAINYRKRFENFSHEGQTSVTDAISHATCAAALKLNAAAIVTVSKTGKTGSDISRFRPDCPVLCVTTSHKVLRQLKLVWGVLPSFAREVASTDELFNIALDAAKNSGLVRVGELVVVTAGVPVGCSGTTNMLKVHIFGDVLCAGTGVSGGTATGELCVANCVDDALLRFEKGNILVLHEMDSRILPLLRNASGLIVECSDDDGVAKTAGLTLEIPVITNAAGALRQLRSGTFITMDAQKGIISMQ